ARRHQQGFRSHAQGREHPQRRAVLRRVLARTTVIPGLVPGIHVPAACAVRGWLDTGDKPRYYSRPPHGGENRNRGQMPMRRILQWITGIFALLLLLVVIAADVAHTVLRNTVPSASGTLAIA